MAPTTSNFFICLSIKGSTITSITKTNISLNNSSPKIIFAISISVAKEKSLKLPEIDKSELNLNFLQQ